MKISCQLKEIVSAMKIRSMFITEIALTNFDAFQFAVQNTFAKELRGGIPMSLALI